MTINQNPRFLERAAGEAHDAMQVVLGSLNLLNDESLNPAQSAHAGQCLAGVHHVVHILEDVLMLSNGALTQPDIARFSPAETLNTITEVLAPLALRRNVSLQLDVSGVIPSIEADIVAFEQIVTRAVEYAIRTVQRGTISVSIRCSDAGAEGTASIQVTVASPEWPITEDSVTLGLARVFASRMGATIDCTRTESGSRIEVSMPVKFADMDFSQASRPAIRILVAEDSDDSYDLLAAILADEACLISRAVNGEQAVAMVEAGHHDMAFMDVNMPLLDGYSATRRIREWETRQCRKRMPIIVLSSHALASQQREGAIVGCSAYMEKPVSRSILMRMIERYGEAR